MEPKKSKEANVDQHRGPFLFIGLLFIGSLVLASFSYTDVQERESKGKVEKKGSEIPFEQEFQKEEEPDPIEEPPELDVPPPPQEEIIEEKNTEKEPEAVVAPPPPVKKGPETKVQVAEEIIEFPDVEAQFPGGTAAMIKWINENVQYPQTSIEMDEQGKVFLAFVVEPDGSITNIVVQRGVSKDLDREAKRVVRSMPKWVPGEAGGRKARTRCRLPINFTLD